VTHVRSPSAVTVRAARPDDLVAVARLAAGLLHLHHDFDPARFLKVDHPEEGYRHFLGVELGDARAVVVVAEESGRITGYAYGRMEPRNWNELLEACGKIHDVYVDASARGHGTATLLVRALVARLEAMGAPRVVLLTATQNESAQKLFARLGFRVTMLEMTRERSAKEEPPARP
jgi:ribosomal protein S18 acetylase RimI-like enzyme